MNGEEYLDLVPHVKEKFNDIYKDNIQHGHYDTRDLEWFETDDEYVQRFLVAQKGSVDKAVQMVDTSLKWRKELGLRDLTDDSFPKEMHELGGVFYHNTDKDQAPILHFQICKHKKDAEKLPVAKKFVAWWIDKHFLKNPGQRVVCLMDMSGAGLGNLDLELVKFQIACFTTYYPALLAYMLIYEMPWILNAIWKIIRNLLSAEQQKFVIFVKKAEVQQYIPKDQLLEHMGGTDQFQYKYVPGEMEELHTPSDEDRSEISLTSITSTRSGVRKRVTFADKDRTMYTSVDEGSSVDTQDGPSLENITPGNESPRPAEKSPDRSRKGSDSPSIGSEDGFVSLLPKEELNFKVEDSSVETLQSLTINNTCDSQVAFKVKTTAPEKFRVRPSTGIIKVNSKAEACIYMQPGHEETIGKEKFLVMVMQVADSIRSASQVTSQWRQVASDPTVYSEYRMRCSVEKPKSPPADQTEQPALSQLMQQMQTVIESQKRLESSIDRVSLTQRLFIGLVVLFVIMIALAYYFEFLPSNTYNVNGCVPSLI